jgi:hypothetical protein
MLDRATALMVQATRAGSLRLVALGFRNGRQFLSGENFQQGQPSEAV